MISGDVRVANLVKTPGIRKEKHLRTRFIGFLGCLMGLLLVLPVMGQDASSAPAEPAAMPAAPQGSAPPTWSVGPINFSGAVDGYYSYNANHPASRINGLYNFNINANQFGLGIAEIALDHAPDPVGFRVDLGFGDAYRIVNSLDNDGGFNRYLQQAYVSWRPTGGKGFQADFGKFVTSAGAEVIESYSNWNYSRSLLFAWAIPYYHFGLRTSVPMGSHFTAGVQVVNGWNSVVDNNNAKTVVVTGTTTFSKFAWAVGWHGGPENANTSSGWHHLIDTTLTLTPTSKVSAYINYDYHQQRHQNNFFFPNGTLTEWQGIAAALKLQANDKWAFTSRGEWFQDRQGHSTGVAQQLKEVTFTGEYKMAEGLLTRAEYRHDWSNQPFFERGNFPGSFKSQDTFTVAFVAFFGPNR